MSDQSDLPDPEPPVTPGVYAERVARNAIHLIDEELADKRGRRDQLAADIKKLVAEKEAMAQVVRAFDRLAKKAP